MRYLKYVFILILFSSCNGENHCLTNYSKEILNNGFSIDSIEKNSEECSYFTSIPLCGEWGDTYYYKGKTYVKDSVFYYKIIEKPFSKYFPLFDMTRNGVYSVQINYIDTVNVQIPKNLNVELIQKIKINNKKEIFIFKVLNLFCYLNSKIDGVFFVTYDEGIIGSYFYQVDEEGNQYMSNSEGNILKEKMDYSKFIKVQFL